MTGVSVTSAPQPVRNLRALPKAHLHVHLDGAVRKASLIELSHQLQLPVPTFPEEDRYESFAVFMEAIQATHAVLRDRVALRRLLGEILADAKSDGAVWVEVSVWPGLFASGESSRREWVETVLEIAGEAAGELALGFGLMLAANRHEPPEAAVAVARIAAAYADAGVVSFGLDGDERAGAPELFESAFRVARDAGLVSTPHAGELLGPDSVRTALVSLGARRILHGVRAVEEPSLVETLASSEVCLDVCPTSNVKLGVVESLQVHPLPSLMAAGVSCTINADDPLLFETSLLEEFELSRAALGMPDEALAAAAADSIRFSGAPSDLKHLALDDVARWLDAPPPLDEE